MKLGIDMGGMSIKMGLVNEENEIIGRITIPTDLTVPYQMLVKSLLSQNFLHHTELS